MESSPAEREREQGQPVVEGQQEGGVAPPETTGTPIEGQAGEPGSAEATGTPVEGQAGEPESAEATAAPAEENIAETALEGAREQQDPTMETGPGLEEEEPAKTPEQLQKVGSVEEVTPEKEKDKDKEEAEGESEAKKDPDSEANKFVTYIHGLFPSTDARKKKHIEKLKKLDLADKAKERQALEKKKKVMEEKIEEIDEMLKAVQV